MPAEPMPDPTPTSGPPPAGPDARGQKIDSLGAAVGPRGAEGTAPPGGDISRGADAGPEAQEPPAVPPPGVPSGAMRLLTLEQAARELRAWGALDAAGRGVPGQMLITRVVPADEPLPAAAPAREIRKPRDALALPGLPDRSATPTTLGEFVRELAAKGKLEAQWCREEQEALKRLFNLCLTVLERGPDPGAINTLRGRVMKHRGIADVDDFDGMTFAAFVQAAVEACAVQAPPPAPRRRRLEISGERVLLDGDDVLLGGTPEHRIAVLCYLGHLIGGDGDRLSDPDVCRAESGREGGLVLGRLDRLRQKLPPPLKKLIETSSKGSRLRPEAWHR